MRLSQRLFKLALWTGKLASALTVPVCPCCSMPYFMNLLRLLILLLSLGTGQNTSARDGAADCNAGMSETGSDTGCSIDVSGS